MTVLLQSRALIAGNAAALDAIRDPEISLAIWGRALPVDLSALLTAEIGQVRLTSDLEDLPVLLREALGDTGYPVGAMRSALEADITQLAERFAAVMRCDSVDVRLERITTDACRKWHADYVTARLITTYVGQGTQWIDSDAGAACDCGDPHDIRQLAAGEVAIFKGRHWDEDRAAIHRSPPIEGSGEQRLLLVINPAERSD
jgi:hypothetical protein